MNNYNRQGTQMYAPCPGISPAMTREPVAMAYVPWQYFHEVYEPDQALRCGTIFPELNKPFLGKRGVNR